MGFIGPVQPPDSPIRWQKDGTCAVVEKQEISDGTLYIAESQVTWINGNGQGFVIPYPAITVHAISLDKTHFPKECLYLMIDSDIMSELRDIPAEKGDAPSNKPSDGENENSDDGYEEEEGTEIREIRFVPQEKTQLQSMFDAMSQCQALHPDPEDQESPDDDDGDGDDGDDQEYEEEDGGEEGAQAEEEGMEDGHADDAMDTGQFEDADMDPEH